MILLLEWTVGCLVALLMAINGVYMLVSPRVWCRLPDWLAPGNRERQMTKQYSTGWGAVQVRIAGGVILATLAWTIVELLTSPN